MIHNKNNSKFRTKQTKKNRNGTDKDIEQQKVKGIRRSLILYLIRYE